MHVGSQPLQYAPNKNYAIRIGSKFGGLAVPKTSLSLLGANVNGGLGVEACSKLGDGTQNLRG